MVKSKIIYDNTIWTPEEWTKNLGQFKFASRQTELQLDLEYNQFFEQGTLQSHYFAILHNDVTEIRNRIKKQVMEKLGIESIAENSILGSGNNCEFYRISTPRQITIYRKNILDNQKAWEYDRTLHTKGPQAIKNLIKELERD